MAVISVNNITLAYGDQPVVKDLSFAINEGDFLVMVGENGAGKTTIVRALLGQLKPKQGDIEMAKSLKIGYVPQFRNLPTNYPLSIRDFAALNLSKSRLPWLSHKEQGRLDRIIRKTDLTAIEDRSLGLASGGEKQRAYLAQALVDDPRLLILDESTASLDNEMKYELLDLVAKFQQNHLSVLFITHDWDLAKRYGTRYLQLLPNAEYREGPINELPTIEEDQHV
ncbi:ATP-binding cassette domain-containing protein [Limosilactobacillus caecicola]|uniref:ATP-binding cassette domain-containing protein n=1 Tax=Limosilactobacillus caecicola TaxID=2941332 RepID=UPI002040D89D|nr:ATP-binding cassette domain-containing protein [Limosilactobacillus caecicola]